MAQNPRIGMVRPCYMTRTCQAEGAKHRRRAKKGQGLAVPPATWHGRAVLYYGVDFPWRLGFASACIILGG